MSAVKKRSWKCDSCKGETTSNASQGDDACSDRSSSTGAVLGSIESLKTVMCSSFAGVNKSIEEVKAQINTVNATIDIFRESIKSLESENLERKKETGELVEENKLLKAENENIRSQLLDLQQYSRVNNLEIVGVPFSKGEDIVQLLKKMAEVIQVPYYVEDISIAHRLPLSREAPRGSHPRIVISFTSRRAKNQWKAAARRCQHFTAAELHNTWPSTRLFANDHLTPHFKAVLGRAKKLIREKKLAYAWTVDCKVLVRKNKEDASATRVWTTQQVEDLASDAN